MNYYPFHIGDYLSATRHLSWEEDAAYRRLLDTYYTTEKALPNDHRAVCRLVLATTDSQREAVSVVLDEFFEKTQEGWINRRADAEIAAMKEKQAKQREKANKRWGMPRAEPGIAPAMPRHTETDAAASKTNADAMPPTPTPTPKEEKKKKQPPQDASATFEIPEWIRPEVWAAYLEVRKRKRAPPTAYAFGMVLTELIKLRGAGNDANAVLEQSIRAGYTDVYALKTNGTNDANRSAGRKQSVVERVEQSIRDRRSREPDKPGSDFGGTF